MASGWIPICKSLLRKREVLALAEATGKSRHEVVGLLVEFWCWADEESPDGVIPRTTLKQLAAALSEKEDFWQAVCAVGWLEIGKDGLIIPNFERWLGQSAKRRVQDAERKKNVRKMSASKADKKRTTEQNRTEQKRTEENRTEEEKGGVPPLTPHAASPAAAPVASETLPTPSADTKSADQAQDTTQAILASANGTAGARPKPLRTPRPKGPRAEPASDTSATPGTAGRKRDELFDALAEVTASDPKVSGSHLGRVCSALRKADPPYTPAELRRLVEIAPTEFPWLKGRITLGFVEKYVGIVRAKPSDDPFFAGLRRFVAREGAEDDKG